MENTMRVTVWSLDLGSFEDLKIEVDLDLASVLDIARIKGLPVQVKYNGEGKITVMTATDEDAKDLCKGCFEEIEARSNLLNSFLNGF